ncbi:MAG: hypothetical protein OEZ06_06795 [Myxococcales bacterium]|nr:hypothetical protein [Myxococcales bacterium]
MLERRDRTGFYARLTLSEPRVGRGLYSIMPLDELRLDGQARVLNAGAVT